mmetsp:Transcript_42082/g.98747  ORF Transcript_42082/g.98747 Transcript_42082/m.98747 type:complete len:238 (-) Transcript_42082:144-857(-)
MWREGSGRRRRHRHAPLARHSGRFSCSCGCLTLRHSWGIREGRERRRPRDKWVHWELHRSRRECISVLCVCWTSGWREIRQRQLLHGLGHHKLRPPCAAPQELPLAFSQHHRCSRFDLFCRCVGVRVELRKCQRHLQPPRIHFRLNLSLLLFYHGGLLCELPLPFFSLVFSHESFRLTHGTTQVLCLSLVLPRFFLGVSERFLESLLLLESPPTLRLRGQLHCRRGVGGCGNRECDR